MNDTKKISALMNFYKRMYLYIPVIISIIGISLIPFLHIIINTDSPIYNLELYYVLFLSNTVVGYLFIYKSSLIIADQKMYLIKIYSLVFEVLRFIMQITVLLITSNFTLYLIVQLLSTLLKNLFIAIKSNKLYPYINNKENQLSGPEKKEIFGNIKSMFMYKFGGVIVNNTDNILISIIVGTLWVGYYSNYLLIVSSILAFTDIVFSSIIASVGNINATDDVDSKEKIFDVINFSAFWIYGFCSICFYVLFEDFILLWLGQEFQLGLPILIAIILNFYIPGILKSTFMYRDTTGLFRQTKYVSLITSLLNLILSIFLGVIFGLAGILYATAISRMLTNVWFEPMMLYKTYFQKSPKKFFLKELVNTFVAFVIGLLISTSTAFLENGSVSGFAIKVLICVVVTNVTFFMLFSKNEEFRFLLNRLKIKSGT